MSAHSLISGIKAEGCGASIATGDSSLREMRMAIDKFDGKKNFSMRQVHIKDTLVQQGIEDTLCDKDSKSEGMIDKV